MLLSISSATATGDSTTAALSVAITSVTGQSLEHAVVSLHARDVPPADLQTIAIMDQGNLQFTPTVVGIQAGTLVSFPNRDDVRHHVYSFSHPNAFELKLYHGEAGQFHRFEYSGVVVLGCNIHDGMVGYLRVVDTPYFAVSDAQGTLHIDNVPAGDYQMQTWHPDLGMRFEQEMISLVAGDNNTRLSLDMGYRAPAAAKPVHRLQSLFR